ncbi:hypothetical protein RUM44_012682 [Polyplax serrata]|uniref:Ubiquitin carboxyl-terminal hydrolase n=1 Tax=Polyplax serrata TaxID=468196 RepID=A0ABR1BC02_POLSC
MPVDITRLTEGWLELESDPGLFMLLLEDFGVKNVQVEEIYDITKPFDCPVYGFIFLFRWIEERRSRRKLFDQNDMFLKEEDVVNNIFFAQQMVPNSCATHALLSVLLNCPKIQLGDTLTRLKAHTVGMTPENKGWAIGNTPELARAHNSHAMPQAKRCVDKSTVAAGVTSSRYTGEAFHFVSYVPIQDRLFELDGLKPYPIDHGPCDTDEAWTEKFRKVMIERLGVAGGEPCHDIRFNLMALIPDRRIALSHKLNMLKTNREIVVTALQQLVHLNTESKKSDAMKAEEECQKSLELGSNSSLTESEAAMISDLKLEKTLDEDEWKKNEDAFTKAESIEVSQFTENNEMESDLSPGLTLSASHVDALSTIKSNLESSSKENIAPTFKIDKKGSLSVHSDYSTPLTIVTSPTPSISGTDTSSDIGSVFNSPSNVGWGCNSCQNSPCPKDFKKFVVQADDKNDSLSGSCSGSHSSKKQSCDVQDLKNEMLKTPDKSSCQTSPDAQSERDLDCNPEDTDAMKALMSKYPVLREPHTFAPKDLLALLKNVETEIANCEASLKDENDKRTKYKIDDCRRTHNYDEFICTFLSMLAEQGKLADLVEQHLHKRPGLASHRHKRTHTIRKSDSNKTVKYRKGKAKHRRRN